jgi:hypothetical protein
MKSKDDIENRVRALLCDELTRRVCEAKTRLPHLCTYNHRHPLDTRKSVEDMPNDTYNRISTNDGERIKQTIGLCMFNAEAPTLWPGNICEDPIDAQRCPYFQPPATKESIFKAFQVNVTNLDWVKANMPELYGLFWALDDSSNRRLPWWKLLWYRLVRINVAPVLPNYDMMKLLPSAPTDDPG